MTFASLALGMLIAMILIYLGVRMLFGFVAQKPEHYQQLAPHLDLRQHLNGPIACEGVIYGPLGRVSSRFVAQMEAIWQGNKCTLKEVFHFDSGSEQHREWRLTLRDDGSILAEADDVVGPGQGQIAGSTLLLKYNIRLTPEAGGHVLKTTDWMYLMENGNIMNRSQMYKFGIKVAELVATMRPAEHSQLRAAE